MSRFTLIGLLLTVATSGGCIGRYNDTNAKAYMTRARMDRGLTLVLPGIEGRSYLNRDIREGLVAGGVNTGVRIHDWTLGPALWFANEMSEGRARAKGRELAEYIVSYKDAHPDAPVFLVGHSGGCAVALFAAEAMPRGRSIEGILLLAPSVGCEYDLTSALRRVDGRVLCYWSPKDVGFLGAAIFIFGNVDGNRSAAAGRVGFALPKPASAETQNQYRKLKQIEWEPSMELSGNAGGHTDWADPRFVRDYVAPQINRMARDCAARHPSRPSTQPATTQPLRVVPAGILLPPPARADRPATTRPH